jgi:predicted permease
MRSRETLRRLFHLDRFGRRLEASLDEELRFHLEERIARLVGDGLSPEEARHQALQALGDLEEVKQSCRRADEAGLRRRMVSGAVSDFIQDTRGALRSFRRTPAFTLTAVFTLAVGIGVNTVVFSVVNGVLLHPLPYPEADRLLSIRSRFTIESGFEIPDYPVGSPEYFDYARENRTLEGVAGYSSGTLGFRAGAGDPEFVQLATITTTLLPTLRVEPMLGRNLTPEEDLPGAPWVFLISHDLWRRRFDSDPEVIGRIIDMETGTDEQTDLRGAIIGVLPPGFSFPGPGTDLYYSLHLDPARTWRGGHWFSMVGRLAPGVSRVQAREEMAAIMAGWAERYPDHHVGHGLWMQPLLDRYISGFRSLLAVLVGTVGLVLLIACLNVAGLLTARGESRRLELAIRGALGADRRRLTVQLLTESALLALLGGALGILLARGGLDLLLALQNGLIPRSSVIALDSRVLGFTALMVVLTTLLFGLLPACRSAAQARGEALRDGGRGLTPGRTVLRLRMGLVVAELALATMLVTGAGLLTRSLQRLVAADPGFPTRQLLTLPLNVPNNRYSPEQALEFFTTVRRRAAALPEVVTASVASRVPLRSHSTGSRVNIVGRPTIEEGGVGSAASGIRVDPGFFTAFGIRAVSGRVLGPEDRAGAEKVVVIDQEMARRYWGDQDPIGERFNFALTDGPLHRIVGVVENVRWGGLETREANYYCTDEQFAEWAGVIAYATNLLVRTRGDPYRVAAPIREIIRDGDPTLAVRAAVSIEDILDGAVAGRRFLTQLLSAFAIFAVLLGSVGIYGLMVYTNTRRAHEFGIRVSLGARRSGIVRLVLGEGVRLALFGALAGGVLALAAGRVIHHLLFEVRPSDPVTYVAVTLGALLVGVLASAWPAWQAARTDPIKALRLE